MSGQYNQAVTSALQETVLDMLVLADGEISVFALKTGLASSMQTTRFDPNFFGERVIAPLIQAAQVSIASNGKLRLMVDREAHDHTYRVRG